MVDVLPLDRIGIGTTDEEAKKNPLQIRDLTLDKCIDAIRASNAMGSRLKMMSEISNEEIEGKQSVKKEQRNPDCSNASRHKQLCIFCDPGHFFLEGVC